MGTGIRRRAGQVLSFAPENNKEELPRRRNVDKVKGKDRYLYRAVDSTGQTIDFLLTAKRDAEAAKRFFRKVFAAEQNPTPRVINVDKNPAYPAAVQAMQAEGTLPRRVRLRQCKYAKQHRRTGSQNREEARVARQRLRLISERMADVTGNRNDAHDQ